MRARLARGRLAAADRISPAFYSHIAFTLPPPAERCRPLPWSNEGRRTMRARRLALGLVVAALGLAATASAQQLDKGKRGAMVKRAGGVNFVSTCRFSHRAPDDPIVFPGHPGFSHDHSFVGNTTTDAFSTLASPQAGSTTGRRIGDQAGYWVPTAAGT